MCVREGKSDLSDENVHFQKSKSLFFYCKHAPSLCWLRIGTVSLLLDKSTTMLPNNAMINPLLSITDETCRNLQYEMADCDIKVCRYAYVCMYVLCKNAFVDTNFI